MKWDVYFEIFGKKMKTEVEADSFYSAQCKVRDKIIFHKVVKAPQVQEDDKNFIELLKTMGEAWKV